MGDGLRHSLCRWCYEKVPLEVLCAEVKGMGFEGVDLVGPGEFEVLKRFGLVGTMTPTHTIERGLAHRENHGECLSAIRGAIEKTAEAGFPNVICFSGNRYGIDRGEGMRNCAAAVKEVVGEAERRGVTLCMELLNSKVDHPDYLCDHTAWGTELVKMVGSPRFKLLYDIYHMQIMEGDIIATIRANREYIGHFHTGGVPGRNEIDAKQELNYAGIVGAIRGMGWEGWIAQEFLPRGEWMGALANAWKICQA
ncbi:MAG: hydroxypyruvate isomerase family protein [Phycisphaerae bacterium]